MKKIVRNGAARTGYAVCSKPVRWDLDDQAGHGQASPKPDKYSLHNNMYECLTCVPKVAVKADGTDQMAGCRPDSLETSGQMQGRSASIEG
jgi:hypothetical protein